MLTLLEENHLFVFPIDKEKTTYTYHALWQDFLRSRLNASTDREEINALHGRAARHFATRDMMETAMVLYFEADP